jgi:hypothetical protein
MWFLDWFKNLFTQKKQQTVGSKFRPDCLKAIEDKPCIPDIYVCRHKCKDAYKCFKKHGYTARAVKGRVTGLEDDHIWMELEDDKGELYWYDPTWYNDDHVKYGCHKASLWTDRKVIRNEIHGIIKPTNDHSPPPGRN